MWGVFGLVGCRSHLLDLQPSASLQHQPLLIAELVGEACFCNGLDVVSRHRVSRIFGFCGFPITHFEGRSFAFDFPSFIGNTDRCVSVLGLLAESGSHRRLLV